MSDLVFFDESHFVSDNLWSKMGFSQKGSAPVSYQQGIWKSQSITLILAIGWNGVVASKLLKGGVGASQFVEFLYECDFKCDSNKIFILDNAPIHRSFFMETNIKTLMESKRTIIFQSKYSPDLNPIEMVFGFLKRRVRRVDQDLQDLLGVVNSQVKCLSVADCRNTICKIFESKPQL